MVEADLRNIAVTGITSAYFAGRGDWQTTLNNILSTVEAGWWFLCLRNLFFGIEWYIPCVVLDVHVEKFVSQPKQGHICLCSLC